MAASKVKHILESIQISGTPNVILDIVKRGEDDEDVTSTPIGKPGSRNVILRLYEAYGGKGISKISTCNHLLQWTDRRFLPVRKAFRTNILEDEGDEIEVVISHKEGKETANMEVIVRPFEVVTLRLEV